MEMSSLDLTGQRLDAEAFSMIEKRLTDATSPLEHLNLSMCKMGVEGAARLSSIFEKHTATLRLSDLDVSWNDLGNEGAAKVAALMHRNTTVRKLVLGNNRIGPEGFARVASALEDSATLTSLDLSGNEAGDDGVPRLAQSIERNVSLVKLDLQVNGIGDGGAEAVARMLRSNRALAVLGLSYNRIGSRGAIAIFDALSESNNPSVVELQLWANSIGDDAAVKLARLLEHNQTIARITLSDNKLTAASGDVLAAALAGNTAITLLDIGGTEFPDEVLDKIRASADRNKAAIASLYDSCRSGDAAAVKSALASSANRVLRMKDPAGKSLLVCACEGRQPACAAALLSAFALRLELFPEVERRLTDEEAAVVIAAFPLMEADALFSRDSFGRTILHWAVWTRAFSDVAVVDAVKALVSAGCAVEARDFIRGASPLISARSSAAAQALLSCGADASACDCFGARSPYVPPALVSTPAATATAVRYTVVLTGGDGSNCLEEAQHGSVTQFIIAATSQFPWWHLSQVAPRALHVGCFPIVEVRGQLRSFTARLCEHEYLDRRTLAREDERNVVFLHVYASDSTKHTKRFWAQVDQCLRSARSSGLKGTSVVAGFDNRLSASPDVTQAHVPDIHADSQAHGVNAHGEFPPDRALDMLDMCAHFHEYRALPAKVGRFVQSNSGVWLTEVDPLPPVDAAFRTVRVIVGGQPGSGKTCLMLRLKHKALAIKKPTSTPESTIGVKHKRLELKRASLITSDMSGLAEYGAVEELFLSPRNAVYVLVFDGTNDLQTLTVQITVYLKRLLPHPRGPHNSCRLLIFCSKLDLVGAQVARANQEALRKHVEAMLEGTQITWDLLYVTSAGGAKKFRSCVKDHIVSIRRLRSVSDVHGALFAALGAVADPLLTLSELRKRLPPGIVAKLDSTAGLWREALDFLRNIGLLTFSDTWRDDGHDDSKGGDFDGGLVLCLNMAALGCGVAAFVARQAHLDRLVRCSAFEARKPRVPTGEFAERVRLAAGLDQPGDVGLFGDLCVQLRLCFRTADGAEFVFPQLLPALESPRLPPLRESDHRRQVLRFPCVCWTCSECGAKSTGDITDICSSCGKVAQGKWGCLTPEKCPACSAGSPHTDIPRYSVVRELATATATAADSRVCLGFDCCRAGKLAEREIHPRCTCAEEMVPVRFLADAAPLPVGGDLAFAKLMCELHTSLHRDFAVWGNAFVLRDAFESMVLVTRTESDRLQIAVRGKAPFLWRSSFPQLAFKSEPHCPYCIQGGAFCPLVLVSGSVPLAPSRRSISIAKLDLLAASGPAKQWMCPRGHTVSEADVNIGAPFDGDIAMESYPWSPRSGNAFFTDSALLWEGDNTARKRNRRMATTTLTAFERTASRQAEFAYAKDLFLSFLGPDYRDRVELRRVSFLNDGDRTSLFSKRYDEMLLRTYQRDAAGGSSSLETAQPNLALGWRGMTEREALGEIPVEEKNDDEGTKEPQPVVFTFNSAQWALSAAKASKADSSGVASPPCLVATWVTQGRIKRAGDEQAANTQHWDSVKVDTPQDGIAIGADAQMLPRYVFHFNSFVAALRDDLKEAHFVLIVVDTRRGSDDFASALKGVSDVASHGTRIVTVSMGSAVELSLWMTKYGFRIPNKLRVATGGDCDVERVLEIVRDEAGPDVPCLVISDSIPTCAGRNVFHSKTPHKLVEFCLSRSDPAASPMSLAMR